MENAEVAVRAGEFGKKYAENFGSIVWTIDQFLADQKRHQYKVGARKPTKAKQQESKNIRATPRIQERASSSDDE